jgi:glyoxylase-like metal-dependent hydrolase (beta-lactamase superfamily II)
MLMTMQRIADNVHFLEGEGFDSNTVIVLGDDPFLVDTGTGKNPEKLFAALKELRAKPSAIVNTHCHYDHCGGNYAFGLPVYAHEPDDEHLRLGDSHCLADFFGERLEPQDARPLPPVFRGWRVIATPGHTEGSCCLLRDGILISGDTIFSEGVGRTDFPGSNEKAMQESLEKISKLDYKWLLPGHGPPSSQQD